MRLQGVRKREADMQGPVTKASSTQPVPVLMHAYLGYRNELKLVGIFNLQGTSMHRKLASAMNKCLLNILVQRMSVSLAETGETNVFKSL